MKVVDKSNPSSRTYSFASNNTGNKTYLGEVMDEFYEDEAEENLRIFAPKKIDPRGWWCVVGGMLIHLVNGNLYLWGNIADYVISYFHL